VNFLNFQNLRKEYYLASFNILKNSSRALGKKLYEFENLYLQNILKGKDMDLHQKSKILGDGIGNFSANLGDKDLLFKLRNIKNHKQLISYFKDLEFKLLKDGDKSRLTKEFHDGLKEILEQLNKSQDNYDLRDITLQKNDYLLYDDFMNGKIDYEYTISLPYYFEKKYLYKTNEMINYPILNLKYSFEEGIIEENTKNVPILSIV